jgi:hypothetical protein
MSSKGLAFHTETQLYRGTRLAVSLAWPALLDARCTLRLAIEGTVVRTHGDLVVMSIASHDFRTSGRAEPAAQEEIASLARDIDSLCSGLV